MLSHFMEDELAVRELKLLSRVQAMHRSQGCQTHNCNQVYGEAVWEHRTCHVVDSRRIRGQIDGVCFLITATTRSLEIVR